MPHFRLSLSIGLIAALCATTHAQTQEQITQLATQIYNNRASNWDWNVFVNRYLYTGTGPSAPQYDGTHLAWGEAYHLRARLSMLRATGNATHLDHILTTGETLFANRADRLQTPLVDAYRGGPTKSWISFNHLIGNNEPITAYTVYTGMITHPIAAAIAYAHQDPQLFTTYRDRTLPLLYDIQQSLSYFGDDFHTLSNDQGRYHDPYMEHVTPSSNGYVPNNFNSAMGEAYVAYYQATGDELYRNRAQAIANHLKSQLQPVADRYNWKYADWDPATGSDTSHAGLDVNFMINAYEAGITFNDTDIQRLANTFKYLNQGSSAFANRIDRSNGLTSLEDTRSANAWLRLTHYDATLRQTLFPIYQNDVWPVYEDRLKLLGSSAFVETGTTYTVETSFVDDFNGHQLNRRWRRSSSEPIANSWNTITRQSAFTINSIDSLDPTQEWKEITRLRDVDLAQDWSVSLDLSWSSTEGSADPLKAVQQFYIELYDDTGGLIARVGMYDSWETLSASTYLQLAGLVQESGANGLSLEGDAVIEIVNDTVTNKSVIYWDDVAVLEGALLNALGTVAIRAGYYQSPTTHFGSFTLDRIEAQPLPNPEPGSLISIGLMVLITLRRRVQTFR